MNITFFNDSREPLTVHPASIIPVGYKEGEGVPPFASVSFEIDTGIEDVFVKVWHQNSYNAIMVRPNERLNHPNH